MRSVLGLFSRIRRRLSWETYSARVVMRRAMLDMVCGDNRQQQLTERLLPGRFDTAQRRVKVQRTTDQILRFEAPARIEPLSGYVVRQRTGLIEESLHYSEDVRIRSQRHYITRLPTVGDLLKRIDTHTVPRAISLRHPYAQNYFHAMTECLGALALLDQHGLLAGRQIIVDRDLAATAVFKHAVSHGALVGRDILVQDHRAVVATQDILVGRVASSGESYRRTGKFLTAHLPPPASTRDIKLYLTRPRQIGRTLRNEAELRQVLAERGYTTVDPGALSWVEQVDLFRQASHVVSVHSSAMTNVMFRTRGSMNVVEIRVPGRINPDFERIVVGLGFNNRIVDGCNPSDAGHRPEIDADIPVVLQAIDELDRLSPAHAT